MPALDDSLFRSLPIKIDPHQIREAVVEIRYISELPFEVIVGKVHAGLTGNFNFTIRQVRPDVNQIVNQFLFYNDSINVQLLPAAFVFSCRQGYLGWNDFFVEISKTIQLLLSEGSDLKIEKCNRVGVRYISQYVEKSINECTKFGFSWGMPEIISEKLCVSNRIRA